MIPSLETWSYGQSKPIKPRIRILEIKRLGQPLTGRPIAWLLIEETTTYFTDDSKGSGSINNAAISISYQRIGPDRRSRTEKGGCFQGGYSRRLNSVSLSSTSPASSGAIFLDLPNLDSCRIGTYFMNEIVQWVQQWPDATVNTVRLLEGQAHGENKERRNRFYEQFGLEFDYTGPDRIAGQSRPMLASELHQVESWKANITEHHLMNFLVDTMNARDMALSDVGCRNRAIKELAGEKRLAEARPILWALKILFGGFGAHFERKN
jgi:hypothetical protein